MNSVITSVAPTLNIPEITTFFNFLEPQNPDLPAHIFCVAFLDNTSSAVLKGYGTVFDSLAGVIAKLETLCCTHSPSPTLHVTLNRTSDSGRKAKDIESVRVLCIDLDTPTDENSLANLIGEYSPHLIVESSPKKYHVYWKLNDSVSLEGWKKYQLALAQYFGGDRTLCQAQKTIRVPGVLRRLKSGEDWRPRIVYMQEEVNWEVKGLTEVEVGEKFYWIEESYKTALTAKSTAAKALKKISTGNLGVVRHVNGEITEEVITACGGRNETLFKVVLGKCKGTILNEDEAISFGHMFNGEQFGGLAMGKLEENEVDKTSKSAWRTAESAKEQKLLIIEEAKKDVIGKLNGAAFNYDYSAPFLSSYRFTDLGLLERVYQRYQKLICRVGNVLYAFDELREVWECQSPNPYLLTRFVFQCALDLISDPLFIESECFKGEGVKREFSQAKKEAAEKKWLGNYQIQSTVRSVPNESRLIMKAFSDFDTDTFNLFTQKELVNLLTGTVKRASPADFLLHRSNIWVEKEAKCEGWQKFLLEVFQDNEKPEEMCGFLQEIFGYSLTGDIHAEKIFIHIGEGSNGKSKVLSALAKVMGAYATRMDCQTISSRKNSVQKELERIGAKIEGKRVVIIDDLDTNTQWNEGFVKLLTSSVLLSRKLYKEAVDVPNRAKFHIGCNQMPVPESKHGIGLSRRLCIIHYPHSFEHCSKEGNRIDKMINEELNGVFNWALEGLHRLSNRGWNLVEPDEVQLSGTEYQAEHFNLDRHVKEIIKQSFEHTKQESEWTALSTVLEFVNSELSKRAISDKVSVDTVGRLLGLAGFSSDRRRVEGVRTRLYPLKILINSALSHLK